MANKKNIIIIGGGAGGLELVAKLCNKFKRTAAIDITLVDNQLKHVWKPLYHEVAAGTFTHSQEEIDYISYAYQKGFKFMLGNIKQINRVEKWIMIELVFNEKASVTTRRLYYDVLVLAIGSQANDFNIPGVKEHCIFIDNLIDAESCNNLLIQKIILSTQDSLNCISINIVGGGATGVELAAELNHVLAETRKYAKATGLNAFDFNITVIEAGKRLLGMLPERISHAASRYLEKNQITILTNTKIIAVNNNALITAKNKLITSSLTIWAAGIEGNTTAIKHDLAVNKIQQFMVKTTLQTTIDNSIFAFGDCASCLQIDKKGNTYSVPPRAQAAHQQASLLVKSIEKYLQNKPLPIYRYRDYGSLISLSRHNVVGNVMSKVAKNLYIEGVFARFAYWSLYKKHLLVLKGVRYVLLSTLAELCIKKQRPEIKLH